MVRKSVCVALVGALFGVLAFAAEAQDLQRGDTVATRPRPELDPLGVRVGGFLLFPSVAVEEYYDDNLFATQSARVDDFLTVLKPRVEI